MKPCCDSPRPVKVIYAGLPLRLCINCNMVDGFFARAFYLLPFNGYFTAYEGSYCRALWRWIVEP